MPMARIRCFFRICVIGRHDEPLAQRGMEHGRLQDGEVWGNQAESFTLATSCCHIAEPLALCSAAITAWTVWLLGPAKYHANA